jgi:hypothetical protein
MHIVQHKTRITITAAVTATIAAATIGLVAAPQFAGANTASRKISADSASAVSGGTLIASAGGSTQVTFGYTGQAVTWQVPAGVTSLTFEAAGGDGGGTAGKVGGFRGLGADIMGTLSVTPGETLVIAVGGTGTTSSAGGWGYDGMSGGPANTAKPSDRSGGAGGGATFIGAENGNTVDPLVISGGGGGFGGGSGDPLATGQGGASGCSSGVAEGSYPNRPNVPAGYKCAVPSLIGLNGTDGTVGPLGGKGGATGGSSTSTGERGQGAQNLGGNGGSGGGGLRGGAAGTGAKGVSAGGGGGAGTSWYDTSAVSNPTVTNRGATWGTTAQLGRDPAGNGKGPGVILTYQ